MADLRLLQEELEQVIGKQAALREANKGNAVWSDEARREDSELNERGKKIATLIEREKQKERDADFENLVRYNEDPQYQIPKAVNADDESKRMLERAGWITRDGYVCRATSLGKELAMYPEEVLWGPMPGSNDPAAAYYKQIRAVFQPEYRRAYLSWLTNKSRNDAMAMSQLLSSEQNALSEGNDGAGGFLVPADVQAEMLGRIGQMGVMRRLSRVVPTARDKVEFPAVAANGTDGSIYSSGFVGGWVGETPAFTETDPSFQKFEVGIKDLQASTKLSNNFLDDAAVNVLAWIAQNGAENLALVEDKGFIAGTGDPMQPRGLLNSGIGTVDVEGTTANTISNTAADPTGSAPKIIDVEYAVPSQYATNASWLMRRAIEGKVRKLVDGNGRFLWLEAAGSGFAGTPRNIDTFPVFNSDFMETDGADGRKVIAFGDFRNYIIAQRAQISTVVLRERFADTRQTGIILFERVGGGVWNTDAFRIGIV